MPGEATDSDSLLEVETLRRLIEEMERGGVDELELAQGSSRVLIRREIEESAADSGARPPFDSRRPRSRQRVVRSEMDGLPVTAPLTGMFYARPQPTDPPYVAVGDFIERGQVVALIETMKLFNEVTAELTGKVVSVVAAEGSLVEAGQALMYVRSEDDGDNV
jgi:acetyl-CoA carboxylase biotin carboxyl carrier protein